MCLRLWRCVCVCVWVETRGCNIFWLCMRMNDAPKFRNAFWLLFAIACLVATFTFFLFEWPAAFSMAAANFLILFFKSVVLTQSGLLEIIWFSRWVHENWGQHVGGGCSPATKGLFFISKVLNCANWKMREVEKVRENYLVYRLSFPILNLVEHILSY